VCPAVAFVFAHSRLGIGKLGTYFQQKHARFGC